MISETHSLPANVATGSYSLRLRLMPLVPGSPIVLLNSGPRDADGRVVLGSINVLSAANGPLFGDGFEAL
jgi:hypothetical protein